MCKQPNEVCFQCDAEKNVAQAQNIKNKTKQDKALKTFKARFTFLDHLLLWKDKILWLLSKYEKNMLCQNSIYVSFPDKSNVSIPGKCVQ